MASGDGAGDAQLTPGAMDRQAGGPGDANVEESGSKPFKAYFDFMADVDDDGFDGDAPLIRRMADEEVIMTRDKQPKVLNERYLVGAFLGDGAYAKVKECLDLQTRRVLAVKIIALRALRRMRGGRAMVEQERDIMATLAHENVARLVDHFFDARKDKQYLVLERCLGSVHDLQARGLPISAPTFRHLPAPQAHLYFRQLLAGVRYLHAQRIVHKDLKPGNLLLTADECVKITDFGVSGRLAGGSDLISSDRGTPAILPPEVASGAAAAFSGFKVDVYGAGVCLYFMLLGRVPYRDANVMRILQLVDAGHFDLPEPEVGAAAATLIRAMMERDPARRLSVDEVLASAWVRAEQPRPEDADERATIGWLEPLRFLAPAPGENALEEALRRLSLDSDPREERRRGLQSLGIIDDDEEEPAPPPPPEPDGSPPAPSPQDSPGRQSDASRRSRTSRGKKKRLALPNCVLS